MLLHTLPVLSLLSMVSAAASSTANDVANGVCKPVTLIFARGTTEPGNMGSIVGPPLATAMQGAFGASNVAVQGVDYPADVNGAISGAQAPKSAAGAMNMAMMAQKVQTSCPSSKVMLAGYSQGAEEVRGALQNLPAPNNVMAAVTFGDPLKTQKFANIPAANTKINCATGDPVCMSMFVITAAHLSYGMNGDIPASVKFVQGLMGSATTASNTTAPAAAAPSSAATSASSSAGMISNVENAKREIIWQG